MSIVVRPTYLYHQIHVWRKVLRQRLAAVCVLALLHHGFGTGTGLGQVLLWLDPLAVPYCVDAFDELGNVLADFFNLLKQRHGGWRLKSVTEQRWHRRWCGDSTGRRQRAPGLGMRRPSLRPHFSRFASAVANHRQPTYVFRCTTDAN